MDTDTLAAKLLPIVRDAIQAAQDYGYELGAWDRDNGAFPDPQRVARTLAEAALDDDMRPMYPERFAV